LISGIFIEVEDSVSPVMWREWSNESVSLGVANTDWAIVDGEAISSADSYLFHDKWITGDFEVEFLWERDTSDSGMDYFYFCHQDMENYYFLYLNYGANAVSLIRSIDGSTTVIKTVTGVTISPNIQYKFKVIFESPNMQMFLDDVFLGEGSDSTYTEGRVGFYADEVVQMASFKLHSLEIDQTYTDRRDLTTSSFRTGFDDW